MGAIGEQLMRNRANKSSRGTIAGIKGTEYEGESVRREFLFLKK